MKKTVTPLLHRPVKGDCELRLPYNPDNRRDIKRAIGPRSDLTFDKVRKTWRFKRTHFQEVRSFLSRKYPEAEVVVDVSVRGKCDIRCVQARGDECACECGGDNHGGLRNSNWTQVGETTLVEDGEKTRRRTYKVGYAVRT